MMHSLRIALTLISLGFAALGVFVGFIVGFDRAVQEHRPANFQAHLDAIEPDQVFLVDPLDLSFFVQGLDPAFEYLSCVFQIDLKTQFDAYISFQAERFWVVHFLDPRGLSFFSLTQRVRGGNDIDLHLVPTHLLQTQSSSDGLQNQDGALLDRKPYSVVLNDTAFDLDQFPQSGKGILLVGVERMPQAQNIDDLNDILSCAHVRAPE